MKNIIHSISFIFAISLMLSCQSDPDNSITEGKNKSTLLDRNNKIQHGAEWDQVQNMFVKLRDKHDPESKTKLALLFIQEARVTGEHGHYYPAALKELNQVLSMEESNADDRFLALSTKAGVELSLHQFDQALSTGLEALQLNTFNAQIYGVLVDAYVELGDYEMAVQMADKMVSIRPDLRSYARVSYLREIYGDLDGAIDAMQMAVAAGFPPYEETAWARYRLGKLYESHGMYDEATLQYQQVLVDRPDYPFAVAALAEKEKRAGNLEGAKALLDQSIEAIPEVSFYVTKVEILLEQNKVEEGMKLLDEIELMLKDDEESGHNMGLQYAEIYSKIIRDQDKALEYAMAEYKQRPLNIEVNKYLAEIYLKRNNPEMARKHYEIASRTNSKDLVLEQIRVALSPS